MTSDFKLRKSWLSKNKWYFIVGLPLFSFVLGPFPFGIGLYFPIRDNLRGHPQGRHGTQPSDFFGLWVRDKSIEFDFIGQAFYLMPDSRFAQTTGMTERHWHFDNNCLFVDSFSRCGHHLMFIPAGTLFSGLRPNSSHVRSRIKRLLAALTVTRHSPNWSR